MKQIVFATQGKSIRKVVFFSTLNKDVDSHTSRNVPEVEDFDSSEDAINLNLDNLEAYKTISTSSISNVTINRNTKTGKLYVVKSFYHIDNFNKEYSILSKLNHYNIIKLLTIYSKADTNGLVFEYMNQGTLYEKVNKHGRLLEIECLTYIRDALTGLNYIHKLGLIHKDVKPNNLILTSENRIQLIDFGLSEFVQTDYGLTSGTLGTPAFLAPECCQANGSHYSGIKSDVWAIGITLLYLLTGKVYYDGLDKYHVMQNIMLNEIDFDNCILLQTISSKMKGLLKTMLTRNPFKRPDTQMIIEGEYIQSVPDIPLMNTELQGYEISK